MRLSAKLLGFLNRAFWKDPDAYLGLRLQYDGPMTWTVFDGVLTTAVSGGSGANLTVDLYSYTVQSLAGFLARQPGYSVPFVTTDPVQGAASALRLVEGSGDIYQSNGDHLVVYTSLLYAWIDSIAVELALAQDAIVAMPAEMSTTTADGTWLDYQGSYYAVPRLPGEPDGLYGKRIIAEVLRPAGNNVAIEAALLEYTGQAVSIVDVTTRTSPEPLFDGTPLFNGNYNFQPVTLPLYNLFDATVGYDLLNAEPPAAFLATVTTIIGGLRDAGMHLRAINLGGSAFADDCAPTSDATDTLLVNRLRHFDGSYSFNGALTFVGDTQDVGTIEVAASTVALITVIEVGLMSRTGGGAFTVGVAGGVVGFDIDRSNLSLAASGALLGPDGAPLLGSDEAPLISST